MKHHRKVNEHNVDLNRNFVFDGNFDPAINREFLRVKEFLNPQRRLESFGLENIRFQGNVVKHIITSGIPTLTTAALLGHHHTPNGIFHGGVEYQEGTLVAMDYYRRALEEYPSVIQIDMHTGYGPRHQMSIIMSPLDPQTSEEMSRKFSYPVVLKINAEEFYEISGEMAAYYYKLRNRDFPTHADASGKAAANQKLSEARALSVKSYLVAKGVKSSVILTSGAGSSQPVVECDMKQPSKELAACLAPNRRVEVEVVGKAK